MEQTKKIRILSLDGGGIRGIVPATILVDLEKRLQKVGGKSKRLADYFDLIAGTSTGGILAGLYLMPDKDDSSKSRYSAGDALDLYLEHGGEIFQMDFLQTAAKLHILFNEMYPNKHLKNLLNKYFEDVMLSDLRKPCLITSYDIRNRCGKFFNSIDAKERSISNFKMKDICRATSAAPTYFEPVCTESVQGSDYVLIDGGVFVNNPALCAYSEARQTDFTAYGKLKYPSAKEMLIISIGTGTVKKPYKYDDIKNAGLISWLPIIIDVMMSGNSETVDFHLRQMYATLSGGDEKDYYRLEPPLMDASSEMDDVSEKNLKNLHKAGLHFVTNKDNLLDEIVAKLVQGD